MKLVCKQLRLSDTWFQTAFVAVFLGVINAAFFLWPDAKFQENLFLVLVIDAFVLAFVFSNTQVWITPQKDLRLTSTIFRFIQWRSRSIARSNLSHVTTNRISDDGSWPNCTTDLYWTETDGQGLIVTKSTRILQRRQELGVSVAEAKQVAKSIGVKFVDNTKKKVAPGERSPDFIEPYF